jgi:hypothetical protein
MKKVKPKKLAYTLIGKILPERVRLDLRELRPVIHLTSGKRLTINCSVLLGQVWVQVETEERWDKDDLRNTIVSFLEDIVARLALLQGYAYDVEITRIVGEGEDWVFGIDNPAIQADFALGDFQKRYLSLASLVSGPHDYLINSCLKGLRMALKDAGDSGFYCYRAIESLKRHFSLTNEIKGKSDAALWDGFRRFAEVERGEIASIKAFADENRHGGVVSMTGAQREKLLKSTWSIVNKYVAALPDKS